nr:translational initiation factor 1 [Clematis fusca]YP_010440485.1 translational initiation factor 1 [Clematis crispa]YP_010440941.1 translational initiation factor 1 [Clematis glaucophylla]YP_010441206.1 translational initiation factor 1 [Clematis huchouensis]YP_010442207.1 translational initiation factor 1 [Clematis reticulata]AIZ57574.1 translational initiation factor 1 [Clematis fusca var. coreana]AIZ57596.1 translational initiation factor 1 [Clematis fusca var. coreana]UIX55325.1 trans
MKEQKWIHEGLITESLSNGMFRVRSDFSTFLSFGYNRRFQISRDLFSFLRRSRFKI